jgi:hypothetical protein
MSKPSLDLVLEYRKAHRQLLKNTKCRVQVSALHASGVRLKELNIATSGGPLLRVKVDYPAPLFSPHTPDSAPTTSPCTCTGPHVDELPLKPCKKRRREKHSSQQMPEPSVLEFVNQRTILGTDMIIGASVDVKHRIKAHLVLRKSLCSGCNMREVVTDTTVSVTGVATQIYLEDISRLGRGKRLNDKIVDLVMGRIQEEARARSGVKADLYMSTYFYNILCAREHRGTMQLTRKSKVDEGNRMYTIVNTRYATHWVAVEICCVQKKVTVIDSIRPNEGSAEYDELLLISKKLEVWADAEAKIGKGRERGSSWHIGLP